MLRHKCTIRSIYLITKHNFQFIVHISFALSNKPIIDFSLALWVGAAVCGAVSLCINICRGSGLQNGLPWLTAGYWHLPASIYCQLRRNMGGPSGLVYTTRFLSCKYLAQIQLQIFIERHILSSILFWNIRVFLLQIHADYFLLGIT